jgi:proteic killer suppression protein
MIASWGDSATEDLYNGVRSARARAFPRDIVKNALRKLGTLNAAISLEVLAAIPGNRLEVLKGDLAGRHSIRVNDQWRVVFRWDNGAHEVRLLDYHP